METKAAFSSKVNGGSRQPAPPPPRKKKITRLIPAEEPLHAIEECTERSEDSAFISEADDIASLTSPKKSCKNGIDKLATQTISEHLPESPLVDAEKAEENQAAAEITSEKGPEDSEEKTESTPGSSGKRVPDENSSGSTSNTDKMTDHDEEDSTTHHSTDGNKEMTNSRGSLDLVDGSNEDGLFDFEDDFGDESSDGLEKEETLTWRLDPAQSLSDWTIIIKSREDEKVESFYVHKNIVAVGPRKCEYFVNVFRMLGRGGEGALPNVTEVELGIAAARVFPQFLDFLYSTDGSLDISTASATGLRYLSQFFGVRVLHKKVMDFIQKDLGLQTVPTYYKDVCLLRDEKLLATIAKYCSRNIMKIDGKYPLIRLMDPYFFARLLASPYMNSKEKKYHVSVLVTEFCRANREKLSGKEFMMLSDEKYLPVVHHSVALALMEMEADLVTATSVKSLMEMSSLQKRCVKDLAHHWKDLKHESEQLTKVCRKLPSSVVTDLLVKTLSNVHEKNHEKTKRRGSSGSTKDDKERHEETREWSRGSSLKNGKHPPTPPQAPERGVKTHDSARQEVSAEIEKLQQAHEAELVKMKKEYESNLVRLRDLLLEKDKTVAKFWNELKSFERLPNQLEGKLVQSGRNHEATNMPEFRTTTAEGYLFASKKGGPKFPLFYYKKEEKDRSESTSTTTFSR